ncbi:MAG: trimethylamine methyltransferase family protein [Candidatus Bipolaricaulota bacterium]
MTESRFEEPGLKFLSESEIDTLHKSSLDILQNTGVIVDHGELQRILSDEGAEINTEENIVKFPSFLIEKTIDRAPTGFKLYQRGRNGEEIAVEGSTLHTHTTGGPSYIWDLNSEKRRDARLEDVKNGAKLVSSLDNIHAYSPLVSPTDVISGAEEIEMVNAALRNTEKIVENPVASGIEVEFFYRLFAAVAGSEEELKQKPSFTVSVSPISPLTFDEQSVTALMKLAEKQLPTKVLPAPTTGGTAPVTFAGAIAQQNAELLAGLTILQSITPGLPTVLGPRLSIMDMRTSYVSWGTPDLGRASACAVQLLNNYDLPSDVYGLSSDAKIMDQQQGYEKAVNGILPALSGANFLSGGGGLESLKSCSLAQLIVDNEIFGMILDTVNGFEINEETIAVDIIDTVGPGGDFLREKHTAKFSRRGEQYEPTLSNRDTWEKWTVKGEKDITKVAREKAKSTLKSAPSPELGAETIKELDRIMDDARNYFKEEKNDK